jgi:hypothetical protein
VGGPAGSLVRTQAVGDQRRVYATQPRLHRCSAPWVSRVGHSRQDGCFSVWLSRRCWLPGLPGGAPPGHLAVLLGTGAAVAACRVLFSGISYHRRSCLLGWAVGGSCWVQVWSARIDV